MDLSQGKRKRTDELGSWERVEGELRENQRRGGAGLFSEICHLASSQERGEVVCRERWKPLESESGQS